MSDSLFVNGLVLHAHHGVHRHETRLGQPFVLDILLEMDLRTAARSDKLNDTASYDEVVETASSAFCGRRCKLVEAAAGAVADALLARFRAVTSVRVTVRKPRAPIAAVFDDVGVTLVRARHG
jgi:dihydroneopterin aldolase